MVVGGMCHSADYRRYVLFIRFDHTHHQRLQQSGTISDMGIYNEVLGIMGLHIDL